MSDSVKVEMIPIDAITVVNPRDRNLRIHQAITDNICNGLMKWDTN